MARPDLMLLDLNLPGIDGARVLAAVRAAPALRRLPVIVLSSSDAQADVHRCYEAGANCYVTKPIGIAAFEAVLQRIESFWLTTPKLP